MGSLRMPRTLRHTYQVMYSDKFLSVICGLFIPATFSTHADVGRMAPIIMEGQQNSKAAAPKSVRLCFEYVAFRLVSHVGVDYCSYMQLPFDYCYEQGACTYVFPSFWGKPGWRLDNPKVCVSRRTWGIPTKEVI